jgi:hypothetical protein
MLYFRNWKGPLLLLAALAFLITACAGQQAKPTSQVNTKPKSAQTVADQDRPLNKSYRDIVVAEITGTPEIMKDYANALCETQKNLLWTLENNRTFERVVRQRPGMKYPADCLLVQAKVSDLRIVPSVARMFGGAFAGSSYMEVDLSLIDAATQNVVRKKHLSTSNNAWAAAWVGGASDNSLPSEMGNIIADYINSITYN